MDIYISSDTFDFVNIITLRDETWIDELAAERAVEVSGG